MRGAGDQFSAWAAAHTQQIDGAIVECVDMRVVDVEDDGTRVVRVYVKWGDEMRHADVRFDRVTWEVNGGE